MENLNYKIVNKELTIEDIIKFHPILEAIHPFSDGNGRLGRLLLTLLFQLAGIGNKMLINFSDVILENKNEYLNELRKVQLTDD
jgi:Fic family protein